MPDRSPVRAPLPLRLLGRLLPREWRERFFEPAFYDLFVEGAHRRGHFGLRVLLMTLDCMRVGVASTLIQQRRPTRTAWVMLLLVTATTLLGIVAGMIGNYE